MFSRRPMMHEARSAVIALPRRRIPREDSMTQGGPLQKHPFPEPAGHPPILEKTLYNMCKRIGWNNFLPLADVVCPPFAVHLTCDSCCNDAQSFVKSARNMRATLLGSFRIGRNLPINVIQ